MSQGPFARRPVGARAGSIVAPQLRFGHRLELLVGGARAGPLLQLHAVAGRGAWHVEALAAVTRDQLVVAARSRHRQELLVAGPAIAPQLQRLAVAGVARAAVHVERLALGERVAVEDLVVATAGRDQLPLLAGLPAAA